MEGNNLFAADGDHMGCLKNKILTKLVYEHDLPNEDGISLCAFAIMEYGGMFEKFRLNILDDGALMEKRTEDIRKMPVIDGCHFLKFNDMEPAQL